MSNNLFNWRKGKEIACGALVNFQRNKYYDTNKMCISVSALSKKIVEFSENDTIVIVKTDGVWSLI